MKTRLLGKRLTVVILMTCWLSLCVGNMICSAAAAAGKSQYIADELVKRIVHAHQGYGKLGLNTAVVPSNRPGHELRIKDVKYKHGLGMHAAGVVSIDLGGEFETFEAEIGLQWNGGETKGSAVFQAFVDDEKQFDSGVMKENDTARKVRVSVKGAEVLRLMVTHGGDGITSDAANWVNARLIRDPEAKARRARTSVNVAQFAVVVTTDPNRNEGTKVTKTQEFPAEDITITQELRPAADGSYKVPVDKDGTGCIGLEWREFRYFRQVGLQVADPSAVPEGMKLQYWTGNSSWQGKWKTLSVKAEKSGDGWVWRIGFKESRRPTDKVRWIFPKVEKPIVVKGLSALTTSFYKTADLRLQADKKAAGEPVQIEIYNGEFLDENGENGSTTCTWDAGKPLGVKVRYAKTGRCKTDQTVLRFMTTKPRVGVAVEHVLESGAIYVPKVGLYVTTDPAELDLAAYKKKVTGSKTLRQQIAEMPEQTFERALRVVHKPIQNRGPMMVSLANDQRKFIAYRHGPVAFKSMYQPSAVFNPATKRAQTRDSRGWPWPYELHATFGDGNYEKITRHLDGKWLPLPVTQIDEGGVVYSTRTFVAPLDEKPIAGAPDWLRRRAVCVVEYTIENTNNKPAEALLTLSVLNDVRKKKRMAIKAVDGGMIAEKDGVLLAFVDTSEASPLEVKTDADSTIVVGKLPAGGKVRCFGYIPAWKVKPAEHAMFRGKAPVLAEKTKEYWTKILTPSAKIELPSKLLSDVIRASQVHIMLAAGNEENGSRIDPWTSADRYGALESEAQPILRGMGMMGQQDFARRGFDYFIARYNKAGFLTTGYTMMGSGWHLWTLAEFIDRSQDMAWFKKNASEIARLCKWVTRQREKTKRLDADGNRVPNYGISPPGTIADWGRFTNMTFQEAHYCTGLREAARVLAKIDHPDAKFLAENAEEYRDCIMDAYRWTQSRSPVTTLGDGTWVPAQPPIFFIYGEVGGFFPGEDGSRAWCKNAAAHHLMVNGIMDPCGEEASWMLDIMEGIEFLRGGLNEPEYNPETNRRLWFDLGGFNKCQPYYRRSVEMYAKRDEIKAFIRGYFNTMPSMLSLENLSLWEHFHNGGGWNKTHETGWFLTQTRIMLMQERGDELWMAPFVTRNWLKDGMQVRCQNMPTNFGRAGYLIHSAANSGVIEAVIDPPVANSADVKRPSKIVLRLRHPDEKPIKSVTLNGRPHTDFDAKAETINVKPGSKQITLRVVY